MPRSGTVPYKTTDNTGWAFANVTSFTVGSSLSAGNFGLAKSTASRTSAIALSRSTPTLNSRTTEAWPSEELDVISLMPSMDRSSCSKGRAIKRSASPGEIPW